MSRLVYIRRAVGSEIGYLVACWAPSAGSCWVGGSDYRHPHPSTQTFFRQWTPGGWIDNDVHWDRSAVVPVRDIYAPDDTHVYTTGHYDNRVRMFNGSTMILVLIDSDRRPGTILGISGNEMYVSGPQYGYYPYRWHTTNGGSWSLSPPLSYPNTWGHYQTDLAGVDLGSLHICGSYPQGPYYTDRAYIATYSGTSIVHELDLPSGIVHGLWYADTAQGWACTDTQVLTNSGGSTWTAMPLQPDLPSGVLYRIRGTSASDIWVVGTRANAASSWHWDGSSWSSPYTLSAIGIAYHLHARTSSDVWAVGWKRGVSLTDPAVWHWDGSAWTDRSFVP